MQQPAEDHQRDQEPCGYIVRSSAKRLKVKKRNLSSQDDEDEARERDKICCFLLRSEKYLARDSQYTPDKAMTLIV